MPANYSGAVSDLSRFLPLSNRARTDEAEVTSNWARRLGEVLLQVSEALEAMPPEGWTTATLTADVRSMTRSIATRLARSRAERRVVAAERDAELILRLRRLALERLSGRPRTRVGVLGACLADAWEISAALRHPITVDATASGAVVLARLLSAPLPLRAVVRDRTLTATDAGWEVGRGPELRGTAAALVLFLYGRAGLPRS